MSKQILSFIISFVTLIGAQATKAQTTSPDVLASDGGFAVSSQGSLSWTMGEVVVETFSTTSNYLTQGFQQPELTTPLSVSVTDSSFPDFNINVFPNPVAENLSIHFINVPEDNYEISIYDSQGKLISTSTSAINSNAGIIKIPVNDLSNGFYLLKVKAMSNPVQQTFTLSKTQ